MTRLKLGRPSLYFLYAIQHNLSLTCQFTIKGKKISSGDPRQDAEYERNWGKDSGSGFIVPEVIKNFLLYFQQCIKDQNLPEIQNQYENG